jgi:hypothetical protein
VCGYNEVFEKYRQAIKSEQDKIAGILKLMKGEANPIKGTTEILQKLSSVVTDDSLFGTHWLDALLYRYTLLSEKIRIDLAKKVTDMLKLTNASDIHIVAYSLGSVVTHDALARLYGDSTLPEDSGLKKLSKSKSKLGGLHMIANVSRVLQSFVLVRESIVKPGMEGCVSKYVEYRHKLDPIPQVKAFNPTDNQNWVSRTSFKKYKLVEPCAVTDKNTHSLEHYLSNPMVHYEIFRSLLIFRRNVPAAAERNDADDEYFKNTLSGRANQLQQIIDEVQSSSNNGVDGILRAAVKLKGLVGDIEESY